MRLATLKDFLMGIAEKDEKYNPLGDHYFNKPIIKYEESISEDANKGDDWLINRTSYIWKVGTLVILDDNKRDFGYVYIGLQRTENDVPEFLGFYHFPDGENTDCGRTITRIVDCLQNADIIFEDDD